MRSALGNFHCVTANPVDKAVRVIYAPTPEPGQFIFQRFRLPNARIAVAIAGPVDKDG